MEMAWLKHRGELAMDLWDSTTNYVSYSAQYLKSVRGRPKRSSRVQGSGQEIQSEDISGVYTHRRRNTSARI